MNLSGEPKRDGNPERSGLPTAEILPCATNRDFGTSPP
jgi:hypothetical protein